MTSLIEQARQAALGGKQDTLRRPAASRAFTRGGEFADLRLRAYYPPTREQRLVDEDLVSLSWSDDESLAATVATLGFDNTDGKAGLFVARPGMIYLFETRSPNGAFREVGRWVAWDTDVSDLSQATISITAYDHLIFVHSITGDFTYSKNKTHKRGWLAHQIAADICRRHRIPVGGLVKGTLPIPYFSVKGVSALDAIAKAYYIDSRKTRKHYFVVADKGRLVVRRQRRTTTTIVLDEAENVRSANFRRSLPENFAEHVADKGAKTTASAGDATGSSADGRLVGATVFDDQKGYRGDSLFSFDDTWAELAGSKGNGTALGGLPYGARIRVTVPSTGRSMVLVKRDIGFGGGKVAGGRLKRVVDIHIKAATQLGLDSNWSGAVRVEVLSGGSGGSRSAKPSNADRRQAARMLFGVVTHSARRPDIGDPDWTKADAQALANRLGRAKKELSLTIDGNVRLRQGDRVFAIVSFADARPMRKELFVSSVSHDFQAGEHVTQVTCRWREKDVALTVDVSDVKTKGLSSGTTKKTGKFSKEELVQLAKDTGFPDPNLAAAVAMAESGGEPSAQGHNTNGSVDRGLWQINSVHAQYDATKLLDPEYNAKAAYAISSGGTNWQPWVAYTTGKHTAFL